MRDLRTNHTFDRAPIDGLREFLEVGWQPKSSEIKYKTSRLLSDGLIRH